MAMVAPVTVMPTAVPVTVPTAMPMSTMVPADFFRLDTIDLVLRYDGRLDLGASSHWH